MNKRNLLAACTAISVFGFAMGMTYPLLSLLLEADGVSTQMIGMNAAMMPIGILLFSPLVPILSQRYGSRQIAIAAAIVTAGLLLAYRAFDSLEAWFVIRLLQGMSVSTLFILSEAWVLQYSGNQHRGKIVALYGAILSASFALGPALLGWIGIEGWAPFAMSSMMVLLSVLPLTRVREAPPAIQDEAAPSGFLAFVARAPVLLGAVLMFAIFDASTLSFLPLYGLHTGLDIRTAALALTALIAGNVILQFPVGWLADKYPKSWVLGLCTLGTLLLSIALIYTHSGKWMWPVLVLLGAFGYGVYTVAMAELGDRYSGNELITGSAAFGVMWGIGALLGSISGGWAMGLFGPQGLPLLIAFSYALLLIGILTRRKASARESKKN